MADQNAVTLDTAAWLPAGEWESATDDQRTRFLAHVADYASGAKRRQVRLGRGADGAALAPVKPRSRPDGATGKPLDPHYGESRSIRYLRSNVGKRHVTLWWSHGFGAILGYHARGVVRHAPVRDVIGFTDADEKRIAADARYFWRLITGQHRAPRVARRPDAPPREAPAHVPRRQVVYLPPGSKPARRSRHIQVIGGT